MTIPSILTASTVPFSKGLALVVFADWYHKGVMKAIGFFDDNTKEHWTPAVGGANVPALNTLLEPYGVALGETVWTGSVKLVDKAAARVFFASGASLRVCPCSSTSLRPLQHWGS